MGDEAEAMISVDCVNCQKWLELHGIVRIELLFPVFVYVDGTSLTTPAKVTTLTTVP